MHWVKWKCEQWLKNIKMNVGVMISAARYRCFLLLKSLINDKTDVFVLRCKKFWIL